MAATPLSVPESALINLLPEFLGYSYKSTGARYPFKIPAIPDSLVGEPRVNNCCTFVEALLVGAWKNVHGDDFEWNSRRHSQIMIMSSDLFGPVTAIVEAGMGEELPDKHALPPPWTIVQGWESIDPLKHGHTFLILDSHPPTQKILTLESNFALGMNGPGFRKVGDLDNFPNQHPGSNWYQGDAVWTWDKFHNSFHHMKLAKLNVEDIGWIASGA